MYEYKCTVNKVIDGDTVDVDIDLGFGIVLTDERVRIMGIDTPESRTRNKIEKLFGLAAKQRLKELLSKQCVLKTEINKDGEDMKGKFGNFISDNGRLVTDIMIEEGHAVAYHGQSKDDIQDAHLKNRKKLLAEGIILQSDINKVSKK